MMEFSLSLLTTGSVCFVLSGFWKLITKNADLRQRRWRDHREEMGLGGAILIDRFMRPPWWASIAMLIAGVLGWISMQATT